MPKRTLILIHLGLLSVMFNKSLTKTESKKLMCYFLSAGPQHAGFTLPFNINTVGHHASEKAVCL